MGSVDISIVGQIFVWVIPGVFAITLHEYAHGWVAMRLGDMTAHDAGRLTLNPIKHVDPVGTVLVPATMLLLQMPFVFGWAKPVPVNFSRLRGGRFSTLLVAMAGPVANVLMLMGWYAIYKVCGPRQGVVFDVLYLMAMAGMAMNLVLILFNLIPLPPLDGGRIVGALLPEALARPYLRVERYGILLLLLLIATGAFQHVFEPVMDYFLSLV